MIWDDLIQGEIKVNSKSFSDPIIVRGNETWTYLLCSIVDDIDFDITHVIRGEDHISNTVAQIQFFEALNALVPKFAHLARIVSKHEKISKRIGGFDIKALRDEKEIEAMTIASFFALIGTSQDVSVFNKLEDLTKDFNIDDFHKNPIHYEEVDLIRLNHKVLSSYSFAEVQKRLVKKDMPRANDFFWDIIRNNINILSESKHWYDVCYEEITLPKFSSDDREFLAKAFEVLPEEVEWNENTWDKWIEAIKSYTDRRGKELFIIIRRALTAMDSGPELKVLLPLIGKEKIQQRLRGTDDNIRMN